MQPGSDDTAQDISGAAGSTGGGSRVTMSASRIRKSFGGVVVLDGVGIELRAGEIHTVMGENGAGKSTLMKILAGVHTPDAGTLMLNGREVNFASPQAALKAGVTLIHQEPLSFPDLTVAENVLFSQGLPTRLGGLAIDWRAMRKRVGELMETLGVSIDVGRKMRGLSVADQQMVELAAALAGGAGEVDGGAAGRLLLMDEPTAALTPGEVERLFRIVRRLRLEGVSIVFVSHRLPEVFDVSDRITVLRDGRFIATKVVSETTPDEIVKLMVGRELSSLFEKAEVAKGEVLLEVEGLRRAGGKAAVSFSVRSGEIVGLAGLVGAGRTELAETIFGLRPRAAGEIKVAGQAVRIRSPREAIDAGLAYVPEDRAHHGLLLPMPISQNISLADLGAVSTVGVLRGRRERSIAEVWREKLGIKLTRVTQPVRQLSGGNQQKVVLAKWLSTGPRVLIVDEPTRGVDVGAKSEVHQLLAEHARAGGAVLMISSDLPEVLAMSDRVLVMRGDEVVAEFAGHEAQQENVMAAATGTAAGVTGRRSEPASAGPASAGFWAKLLAFRELGVLVFLLAAVSVAMAVEPRFRTVECLQKIAMYIPLILIVAIGQMKVILSRNIDLSVGSTLGLSAIIACGIYTAHPEMAGAFGWLPGWMSPVVAHPGAPVWLAGIVAVGVGAIAGMVNGLLVAVLRVPAIIATLGTLTAYRGLIYIWSAGRQVDPDKIPDALLGLTQQSLLGLPWIVWISLAVTALAWAFLGQTVRGRQIYALGSNPEAARLRGIQVRRLTIEIFTLSGALAGLAGLLFGSRFGTVNPNSVGVQMELMSISAVVIGGAAVAGGAGSALGTLLGCLLLGVINVTMVMLGVSELWQLVVYGSAILLACLLDAASSRAAGRAA